MMTQIQITQLPHGEFLPLPTYATPGSAGMDLCAAIPAPLSLASGTRKLIPTGIQIALPTGFEAQVRGRSGLALKHGIAVLTGPGTIDSDYRGEIQVILMNHDSASFLIEPGMRIAQLVIARFEAISWTPVSKLPQDTLRGAGGFGSTG